MLRLTRSKFSFTYPCPRKLREIMQMSLIERESSNKIITIWDDYHKPRPDNVAVSIDEKNYTTITNNLKRAPMFMFPVKKGTGHFKLISQKQENSILFTYMAEYQKKGVHAAPYVVFTFFEELLKRKHLALLRGDIIDGKLTKEEGEELLKNFLMFYLTSDLMERFVVPFNEIESKFDYLEYCRLLDIQPN